MQNKTWGLLSINKPAGLTSRDVVNRIAKKVKPIKVGHAGTLDPMATGVLILCIGSATRLVPFLQHHHAKEYRAKFLLGQTSTTDDVEGEITVQEHFTPIAREKLEALLPNWIGDIEQVPPAYSAVHINGQRAYKLAREGKSFDIPAKKVRIDSLELTAFDGVEFELTMKCGPGTYVRSLGRDLGKQLGCGAVMSKLERTAVGSFSVQDACLLEDLNLDAEQNLLSQSLLSPFHAVSQLQKYRASLGQITAIQYGNAFAIEPEEANAFEFVDLVDAGSVNANSVNANSDANPNWIAVATPQDELVALCEFKAATRQLQPKRVFKESLELYDQS